MQHRTILGPSSFRRDGIRSWTVEHGSNHRIRCNLCGHIPGAHIGASATGHLKRIHGIVAISKAEMMEHFTKVSR